LPDLWLAKAISMSCALACYEIESAMKVMQVGAGQEAISGSFDPPLVEPMGELSQAT
jgi:hypothetical protein